MPSAKLATRRGCNDAEGILGVLKVLMRVCALKLGCGLVRYGVVVMSLSAGAVSFACDSGDGSFGERDGRAAESTPSPPFRPPALIDPDSFELREVAGQFDSYTIDVPSEWAGEDLRTPGGFGQRYVMEQDGVQTVIATVRCEVGATLDDMMWLDGQITRGLNGQYVPEDAAEVTMGTLRGRRVDFSIPFVSFGIDHRTYYFHVDPCGWRIDFQTLGTGLREHYSRLFERIVASFHPEPFSPPFDDRNPYLPSRRSGSDGDGS